MMTTRKGRRQRVQKSPVIIPLNNVFPFGYYSWVLMQEVGIQWRAEAAQISGTRHTGDSVATIGTLG